MALGSNGVDDDIDLPEAPAVDRCASDTRYALDQWLDVVECVVIELRARHAATRDGNLNHGGVRWVVLQYEGRNHAERLWNGGHREGDVLLHERLCASEIRAPLEPNVHDAQAVERDALQVIDPRRCAGILFDAPGDRFLHVSRCQSRHLDADHEDGRREFGKRVHGHAWRDDHREDDQADADHQDRDGVAERETRHGRCSVDSAVPAASAAHSDHAITLSDERLRVPR